MHPVLLLAACAARDPDPKDEGTVPSATGETGTTAPTGETAAPPVETGDDCAALCDDGLDCSRDTCDDQGRCIAVPESTCAWPTLLPPGVTALAGADSDLRISLSGADWDGQALWTVRGNDAEAWRWVEDGGGWRIDGNWRLGDLDAESVVVVDPVGAPNVLHVMMEIDESIAVMDVSGPDAEPLRLYDTSPWLPLSGILGSEGLAFVPDAALTAWDFVDPAGQPRTSTLGMGGLFFVGHQNGGLVHVFDLSSATTDVQYVGAYETARNDVSALDFDADTGRLYVWHGDGSNDLEVVRLSSTDAGGGRRAFDTEYLFDYPGSANLEGFALMGLEDCGADGGRRFFFSIDDGNERALDVYDGWPLCRAP